MSRLRIVTAAVAMAMTAAAFGGFAPAARAANSGSTTATFSITGGTLNITVPASTVNLGSASAGALTLSGQLGTTTVNDNRGALVAVWTVTVSSTNFTTGGGSANETVTNAKVGYASGAASSTTGTGAFVPTAAGLTLAAPGVGAAWTGGVGVNSATWNPTISFTLLGSQVAGTYNGTITQSVA